MSKSTDTDDLHDQARGGFAPNVLAQRFQDHTLCFAAVMARQRAEAELAHAIKLEAAYEIACEAADNEAEARLDAGRL